MITDKLCLILLYYNYSNRQQYQRPGSAPSATNESTSFRSDYQSGMSTASATAAAPLDESMTEEERIQAMFQQSEDYWQSQEKTMS